MIMGEYKLHDKLQFRFFEEVPTEWRDAVVVEIKDGVVMIVWSNFGDLHLTRVDQQIETRRALESQAAPGISEKAYSFESPERDQ